MEDCPIHRRRKPEHMPAPFPTLILTTGLIAFFIALRISVRDQDETAIRDFALMATYSLITAIGVRLFILFAL